MQRVQIGIDENGLGPRLGPMTVTGVRVELDPALLATPTMYRRLAERCGIGDSKAQSAHGSMGPSEGRVLALLDDHLDLRPTTLTDLAHRVGLEDEASLRRNCPTGAAPKACFQDPVALPAFGPGPSPDDRRRARELRENGVRLRAVRVAVVCAKRINDGRARGASRFDLDLACMVQLATALRGPASAPLVEVLCGKVGGRARYAPMLEPLSALVGVVREERSRSSYSLPGFGTVDFVLDGDASEPAIGLASMVGKYLRELLMHRLNLFWIANVSDITPVSGYHDPVTNRFVLATVAARRTLEVPSTCFER